MKNYVVGILSFFDHELKLFKVSEPNEYEAIKNALRQYSGDDLKYEIELQNSPSYPKDVNGLSEFYEDMVINFIEV